MKKPQDEKNQISESSTMLNRLKRWDWFWVLIVAALIFIVGLFLLRGWFPWFDKQAIDTQISMASVIVVAEVAWFAVISSFHARRQANLSLSALDVAMQAQRGALLPIIKMESRHQSGQDMFSTTFKNVGPGAALRFQCWLESENSEVSGERFNMSAIGSGEVYFPTWTKMPVSREGGGFDTIAQYEDVFGCLFESVWHVYYGKTIEFDYKQELDTRKDKRKYEKFEGA